MRTLLSAPSPESAASDGLAAGRSAGPVSVKTGIRRSPQRGPLGSRHPLTGSDDTVSPRRIPEGDCDGFCGDRRPMWEDLAGGADNVAQPAAGFRAGWFALIPSRDTTRGHCIGFCYYLVRIDYTYTTAG